jgi:hypothetical protein
LVARGVARGPGLSVDSGFNVGFPCAGFVFSFKMAGGFPEEPPGALSEAAPAKLLDLGACCGVGQCRHHTLRPPWATTLFCSGPQVLILEVCQRLSTVRCPRVAAPLPVQAPLSFAGSRREDPPRPAAIRQHLHFAPLPRKFQMQIGPLLCWSQRQTCLLSRALNGIQKVARHAGRRSTHG